MYVLVLKLIYRSQKYSCESLSTITTGSEKVLPCAGYFGDANVFRALNYSLSGNAQLK
jgi:hypothetical protein